MAKAPAQTDVLVLGDHPAAYFAAALLRQQTGGLRVVHATIPGDRTPGRLVLVNPALFSLHKVLDPLKRKLDTTSVWGAAFLADQPDARSEHRDKSVMTYVAQMSDVQDAMKAIAEKAEVQFKEPKSIDVESVDERGVVVTIGRETLNPRAIVLAGQLPPDAARTLAMPQDWSAEVRVLQTFVRLKGDKWFDAPSRPILPMSLDLAGQLHWAWMLPGDGEVQLCVQQPMTETTRVAPTALLKHWATVLRRHDVLKSEAIPEGHVESMEVPLAGALEREGVASRTLLIGPAGGFFAASGEDLHPNCWSAVYAVDVLKKALKEPHLQDALQPYRQKWGATLGEYLRGPQQNLRFLMPLIYRNPVMTQRLTESILLGKQVVR